MPTRERLVKLDHFMTKPELAAKMGYSYRGFHDGKYVYTYEEHVPASKDEKVRPKHKSKPAKGKIKRKTDESEKRSTPTKKQRTSRHLPGTKHRSVTGKTSNGKKEDAAVHADVSCEAINQDDVDADVVPDAPQSPEEDGRGAGDDGDEEDADESKVCRAEAKEAEEAEGEAEDDKAEEEEAEEVTSEQKDKAEEEEDEVMEEKAEEDDEAEENTSEQKDAGADRRSVLKGRPNALEDAAAESLAKRLALFWSLKQDWKTTMTVGAKFGMTLPKGCGKVAYFDPTESEQKHFVEQLFLFMLGNTQ